MIIFSDLHLEEKSADTVWKVLEEIPRACERHGDGVVGFLGDWWMVRHTIPAKLLLECRDILKTWVAQGIQAEILVGNHDQVDTSGRNVLEVFEGLEGFRVHTEPAWTRHGLWVPYRHTHEEVLEALDMPKPRGGSKWPKVLFAHIGILGSWMNNTHADDAGLPLEEITGRKFKRVFLGHYHRRQTFGKTVEYVGSPYQVSYSEAGQLKGYVHWDGKKATFHDWDIGPKHHKLVVDADNPGQLQVPQVAEGDRLWVEVKGSAAAGMKDTVAKALQDAGIPVARIDATYQAAAVGGRLERGAGDTLDDLAHRFLEGQNMDNPAMVDALKDAWERIKERRHAAQ